MSTEADIQKAIKKSQDELAKELLWIRANEGLTHTPWAKLDKVQKMRINNIYNILLGAMEVSNVKGCLDALNNVLRDPRDLKPM